MSHPTQEQWNAMAKLVQQFFSKPDAEPFREEVPWKMMGLIDYPKVIKKPMDLGLVKKKIASKEYKTLYEAAEDVRLVWQNCMTYNADGSEFFLLAQSLSKKWEEKYAKLLKDLKLSQQESSGKSQNTTVSLEERRSFAKSLYKITKEELGKVLVELDNKCPEALTKNQAEDEMEINVDNIKPDIFVELVDFVNSCPSQKKKKSNKRQRPG